MRTNSPTIQERKKIVKKVEFDWNSIDANTTSTCCGVLEVGALWEDSSTLYVRETEGFKSLTHLETYGGYYDWSKGKRVEGTKNREATLADVIEAFKNLEKRAKSSGQDWGDGRPVGLITCYLLPKQENGLIGQAVRACKWELVNTFQNPKTSHILYHYTKVLKKPPTFKKRKYKSKFKKVT